MPGVNLADFLLARIAEDEAERAQALNGFYGPDRIIADCAAKRRIVDMRRKLEHPRGGLLGPNKADAATAATLVQVFKLMAVPYAGHPDYDPEWRV